MDNQIPWITPFIIAVTNFGPYLSYVIASIIAFKGGIKERKALFILTFGILLSFPIISFIHLFLQIPRPFITYHFQPLIAPPNSFSFPSAHATCISIMAFAYFFTKSKWAWPFLILAIFVGFTRVYVGVHFPIDILGGLLLGFVISYLIGFIMNLKSFRI